ncbi:hypothetical protein P3X46_025770 [Hevea brasiliensis]|uniref:LOB domain-containing protein n=1 Tax=Hevea brasiliensis TaxID=3981 RepID=A0ABQ9L6R4_HEVBR|nr:hypothetical protein P3X46_025770 [Hevea brasiliensis]
MRSHEHRSSSSCAACKFLKRRCIPNCIFAPYFRSDEPKKFARVHKVFVPEGQREETVNSLAYEAEARLKDPVYGCIGAIALLARLARRTANSSSSSSSSSSSTIILNDRSSIATFSEFPAACGGLIESFGQNSSESSQDEIINDFSQFPYIF